MKQLSILALLLVAATGYAQTPRERIARAQATFQLAGELAQKNDFGPANVKMAEAFADFDKAVADAPNDFEVRLARGTVYGQMPPFLNKGAIARQDLEWLIQQKEFTSLSAERQARAYVLLGTAAREPAHFQKAISLSPESSAGKRAAEELAKLKQTPIAFDSAGRPMPDRYPNIKADMSPLVAAATITLPGENITKEKMAFVTDAMKGVPGLLGTHLLQSVDKPGMAVLLTFWKTKVELMNFFYGEIHRSFTNRVYGQPAKTAQSGTASQVGVELFAVLPAGSRIGGGLIPDDLFDSILKNAVK